MRWRVLAFVSLGVNLVLAAIWLDYSNLSRNARGELALNGSGQTTNMVGRTNVFLRRQFFSWQEIESPDYQVYIANLRDIGCPEQTIRDIIIGNCDCGATVVAQRAGYQRHHGGAPEIQAAGRRTTCFADAPARAQLGIR